MILRSAILAIALTGLVNHGSAAACTLAPEDGSATTALDQLPDGIVSGAVICPTGAREVSVWTMTVDGGSERLGVRDNPLFRALEHNPLIEVAAIGYGADARFTVFRRAESLAGRLRPGQPDRVFGTLCAGVPEHPLDCSLGAKRVKMRVDIRDADADGAYDHFFHEISVYDGANRLQVIYIVTPYSARPQALVYDWLSVLRETGAVALPG